MKTKQGIIPSQCVLTEHNLTMTFNKFAPEQSELGKQSQYHSHYQPDKLFPIPRDVKRVEIGITDKLPFFGFDLWNHYEVSWLNEKGKPIVAIAEISYSCDSPYMIESKSMKLYFNSLNQAHFKNREMIQAIIKKDLEQRIGGVVSVKLMPLADVHKIAEWNGICIDELDIECTDYQVVPTLLQTDNAMVEETLHTHLLKSNCLVTGQPDWGSVEIAYRGKRINREALLRYIVSFRNHNEFHEQCIERIFMDIMRHCQPEELTVYGRFTRRGGLDINPFRSTKNRLPEGLNVRLVRQ